MKHFRLFLLGLVILGLVGCKSKSTAQRPTTLPVERLSLPSIFGNDMVLQHGKPVVVWGWTRPGNKVTVALGTKVATTRAGKDGRFEARLGEFLYGGPHELTVSDNTATAKYGNIMIGEIWICSGQSNMEWSLGRSDGGEEATKNAFDPNLRLFTVKKRPADKPQADVIGQWTVSGPETATSFSAVGFYFGRELRDKLKVPVGLIHTSWGGSPVEVWMDREALEKLGYGEVFEKHLKQVAAYEAALAKHREAVAQAKRENKPRPTTAPRSPWAPTSLYNGMVAGLAPFKVAGAIWYQGESNAAAYDDYAKLLPGMIESWRDAFGQDFAFLIVQLANYMARSDVPSDTNWARLREAQTKTAERVKGAGLAVTIDIGVANDIHPRNKLDVGKRLALAALSQEYNRAVVYSGPKFKAMKVTDDQARLEFEHKGTGLMAKGDQLRGFAIAGEDRKFVWADAKIEGDLVIVSSPSVPRPMAVRYAWGDNPEATLYNKQGLPAIPFRTDDWPKQ